jgi:membrane associated rhomboid family serine protease
VRGAEFTMPPTDVTGSELGVARWAHVGGFVFGASAAIVASRMKLVYIDGGAA